MSAAKKSSPAVETRAPQETAELIGQGQAEAALTAAQKSGRMPHAWLFHGGKVERGDLRLLAYMGETVEELEILEAKVPRLLGVG